MPQTGTSAKTIKAETIWDRLRDILGSEVNSGTSTDDVIGEAKAVRAFADKLNKSDEFKGDRLALEPGNFAGVTTVGGIATAIISWYQRNGWTVTA